jgi:DNA-binding NtrC family response regulator
MPARKKRPGAPFWVMLEKAERDIHAWALGQTDDNIADAADVLGIDKDYMYLRLCALGLRTRIPRKKKTVAEAQDSDDENAARQTR